MPEWRWLMETSITPLCLGAMACLLTRWRFGPLRWPLRRALPSVMLCALLAHLLPVWPGLLVEGSMLNYGVVLLATSLANWLLLRPDSTHS